VVFGVGIARILEEIAEGRPGQDVEQLASDLRGHLKDKRFLILVTNCGSEWKRLLDALLHAADGCHPGSAIILTTWDDEVALSSSYKIINARNLTQFYNNKANKLTGYSWYKYNRGGAESISEGHFKVSAAEQKRRPENSDVLLQ